MLQTISGYHAYVESAGTRLFTAVLLPNREGTFPTVIMRDPYVDSLESKNEEAIVSLYLSKNFSLLQNGYAVVIQHCRGRGKSDGDCVPYINEREDGLCLQAWIRRQSFYNGELFLWGGSYSATVHYETVPFADDIKGAYFFLQDCLRYNICYRNGNLKIGLLGNWYVDMYKRKSLPKKNFAPGSFNLLPLSDFSRTVFGEAAEEFDEILRHPDKNDGFWKTKRGGAEENLVKTAGIPMLFTTGFYDIYTGGIFDMWNSLDEVTRSMSALVVGPYGHGADTSGTLLFPNGARAEAFGKDFAIRWLNHIRGTEKQSPFKQGKITYYSLFENVWKTDDFKSSGTKKVLFGKNTYDYVYNPYAPPGFRGGLSTNNGGVEYQDAPNSRYDIVSVYSEPFAEDVCVKGKMQARLSVSSDCEDTCFCVRLSITRDDRDYGLRDDITTLCGQLGDYTPDSQVFLDFSFDEHAFLIRKGERLRMDIASADAEHYVRHTNTKGLFSQQKTARIAHNAVYLEDSYLVLPTV